jgi:flagellar basal-body rod protein FlgG
MNRGIYPILTGSLAQEDRIHVLANNVANLKTVGFKHVEPVFKSVMGQIGAGAVASRASLEDFVVVAPMTLSAAERMFVVARNLSTDFSVGELRETKKPFDLAIKGNGLFEIKTPNGVRYTRNGMFHLDDRRRLVTVAGDPVMGTRGEIALPKKGEVQIEEGGRVVVDGKTVATVKVVEFPDKTSLQQAGEGYYEGINGKPVANPPIVAGFLEESNVNAFEEMVKMIEVMRSFEWAQKVIQTYDKMAETTIQDVGRVT